MIMKETQESFVFYASFKETVDTIKDERIRHRMLDAIIEYGLYKTFPDFSDIDAGGLLQSAFVQIRYAIDSAKRNRGGAPKGNNNASKNNSKQPKTTENNQNNLCVNVNENINKNDKEINENENVNSSLSLSREDLDFVFELYKEYPELKNFDEGLSFEQWKELCKSYETRNVQNKLREIANTKGITSKNSSLYLTLKSWLERDVKN